MRLITFILVAFLMIPGLCSFAADVAKDASQGRQLHHVVLIKFKPGTEEGQMKQVEQAFVGLKEKVPGVTSLKWGTNVSPEKKNKGFTHAFVLTFSSEKDRDGYLVHPAHKDFGKVLGPILDDVLVIDFWTE